MGLKELKKKIDEDDTLFCYKQVFTFVLAVVSMVLAIVSSVSYADKSRWHMVVHYEMTSGNAVCVVQIALVQLQTVASDVSDVLDNWEVNRSASLRCLSSSHTRLLKCVAM